MQNKSSQTRDRILDSGLRLVSVNGLAGVTLGVLADEIGMSKSGLFAHFRSKEELQLRLLERVGELFNVQVVEPSMSIRPGIDRLTAFMKNWLGWAARAGLPGGCPAAAAMFELDDQIGELRTATIEAQARFRAVLLAYVQEAIDLGALKPDTDAAQLVWEMAAIYLAHHVSARFERDPAADQRAWTAFTALLDRYRA